MSEPVLRVSGLEKRYSSSGPAALSDVTFADEAGRPGVGGNGHGRVQVPDIAPSRKRVAAARSAGER